jgi:hypothetical protein
MWAGGFALACRLHLTYARTAAMTLSSARNDFELAIVLAILAPGPAATHPVRRPHRAAQREPGGDIVNCYDCVQLGCTTSATAVCRQCGVAACSEHVHSTAVEIRRTAGMGPSTLPVPARRITCTTCYAAEHSADHIRPAQKA